MPLGWVVGRLGLEREGGGGGGLRGVAAWQRGGFIRVKWSARSLRRVWHTVNVGGDCRRRPSEPLGGRAYSGVFVCAGQHLCECRRMKGPRRRLKGKPREGSPLSLP